MGPHPGQREEITVKHPRRAAVVVTGVAGALAVSACVVAGQVGETPAPRSTAASASDTAAAQSTPSSSAEFLDPLHVPTHPGGVVDADDGTGVLWPGTVVTPTPTAPPRAVIRPA